MIYTKDYKNLEEKQGFIDEAENNQFVMLHDDLTSWFAGTLTFTNELPPPILPPPRRNLEKELDDLKDRVKKLEK